jgi:hypothetical protein
MGDHVKARETLNMQIPSFSQIAYDNNFKLMVIRPSKKTNNCATSQKKKSISWANVQ